jgi:hypothetical protein
MLIDFSNQWSLVKRPGIIADAHEYISRGIDSMTLVPYQCVKLIFDLSITPLAPSELLKIYAKSFSMLAFFASGDREIAGLVRRFMEKPQEGIFDPQKFQIAAGGGLKPKEECLQNVDKQVRQLLLNLMLEEKIWLRGNPRIVTYCPAVIARKYHKNTIRDIFDWTLDLFGSLTESN